MSLLSLLIFVPLLAGLIILVLPSSWQQKYKFVALGTVIIQLVISAVIYLNFDGAQFSGIDIQNNYQLVERVPWISLNLGSLGYLQIEYFLGIDGLSMPLLVLSSAVMLIAVLSSW